jgi:hypothetical protein
MEGKIDVIFYFPRMYPMVPTYVEVVSEVEEIFNSYHCDGYLPFLLG